MLNFFRAARGILLCSECAYRFCLFVSAFCPFSMFKHGLDMGTFIRKLLKHGFNFSDQDSLPDGHPVPFSVDKALTIFDPLLFESSKFYSLNLLVHHEFDET